MEQLLTVTQAAEVLQVSRQTIIRRIKSGDIQAAKVGKLWRISRESLQEYLEKAKK